jgi:kynureninase
MNQACKAFRVEWLGGETGSTHANECPACAGWASSSKRVVAALASLERVGVPAELEQRVTLELAGDRSRRLQRVLNSFVRRGAPAALDGRVAELLGADGVRGDEERGQRKAEILRSLDVRPAPDVLERLLNEELAAPERQRVDRFSGALERMRAPTALAERLGYVVRRRAFGRLVLGPLATLAAAGLVVWIAVRRGEPDPRHYRFEVIQAASLEGIDPLARMLAESLNGGASVPGGER